MLTDEDIVRIINEHTEKVNYFELEADSFEEYEDLLEAYKFIVMITRVAFLKSKEDKKLTQDWINNHLTDGHNVQMGEKVIYVEHLEDLIKEDS